MDIRSKMAAGALMREQRELKSGAWPLPIFMKVLRGDEILPSHTPLLLSYLMKQGFRWSTVMVWRDMIGQGFRDLGLAQTLYIRFWAGQ